MSRKTPRRLLLSLLIATVPLAACAEMDATEPNESTLELDLTDGDQSVIADEMAAMDPAPSCPNQRTLYQDEEGDLTLAAESRMIDREPSDVTQAPGGAEANACGCDMYFHPYNGAHGGWIEPWRLCYQGGNQYQICTGGYAPVRFWNPSACGGSVQDWYPQGWHGWVQTYGCCC